MSLEIDKKVEERVFEEDLKVNKYKLPDECEQHAGLFRYWTKKYALAKAAEDEAYDRLKLVTAESELDVRDDWVKYSDAKMTEAGVKAVLENHSDIIKAKAELRECKAAVYLLETAQFAMTQRKDMINNLVQMLIKGFYAAPDGGKKEGPNEQAGHDIRGKLNKGES